MAKKKYNKGKAKRKRQNIIRIIFLIIALVFFIISIKFYQSIINTNMLPTTYITVFTAIIIAFTLILIIGLAKKHKTFKLNVISLIIIIVLSSAYIFANNYVDVTMKFLNKILTEIAEVEQYYVIVKKDSNYNNLEDINNKELYIFQVEEDVTSKIQSKANVQIRYGDSLTKLGNDLLDNQIDIIIVSLSQYNMLSEEIDDFVSKTKIIDTEIHKIQNEDLIEDVNSKYTIQNKIFNIYISGIDTYGSINNVSRSDANIVATVNLNTHEVLLTSIPRDYYVTLHRKKAKDKLTHSGMYGITETVTTVEDLLDIDINYYARVNFTTVIKLVDALGGIDVYSECEFDRGGYKFKKGYNHLNGEAALIFSRERYLVEGGDNQRIKNQQKVIEAIINKTLTSKTILTKYTNILDSLSESFNTNIDQSEISNIVKIQLNSMPKWKIKNISLEGIDAQKSTYSMGNQLLYVMLPKEDSIKKAKTEIERIMENM